MKSELVMQSSLLQIDKREPGRLTTSERAVSVRHENPPMSRFIIIIFYFKPNFAPKKCHYFVKDITLGVLDLFSSRSTSYVSVVKPKVEVSAALSEVTVINTIAGCSDLSSLSRCMCKSRLSPALIDGDRPYAFHYRTWQMLASIAELIVLTGGLWGGHTVDAASDLYGHQGT
ncbi:hypothetical protein M426DRAFT_152602 [Hypoxylon sp. CI-4A]|nr:hypothetical protein M426DRAFT_152602 [Hypoxylon sp. CI-4A]